MPAKRLGDRAALRRRAATALLLFNELHPLNASQNTGFYMCAGQAAGCEEM